MSAGLQCELVHVLISDILIDDSYQRPLDQKRINRARKAFESGACKAVSLSRRNGGSLYAYDGQHTVELCKQMGFKSVPATVVEGDREKEARWFVLMNSNGVSKADARDVHRAETTYGDETATELNDLLYSYGLLISNGGSRKGTISCVGTLKSWLKKDKARLSRAMDMIDRLWCNEDHAWTQVVIRGAWDIASNPDLLEQVEKGLAKHKVTPRRLLDTMQGMQAATGTPGGGSGYSKSAYLNLSRVKQD